MSATSEDGAVAVSYERLNALVERTAKLEEALEFIVEEVESQRRQHGHRTGKISLSALDRIEHEAKHALGPPTQHERG